MKLPKVMVVITGKGAGKVAFEREVEKLEKGWKWVRVRTAWLAMEDYPKLLGESRTQGTHNLLAHDAPFSLQALRTSVSRYTPARRELICR